MIVIIIILCVIIFIMGYMLRLSIKRLEDMERFILQLANIIDFATIKMKQVDSLGHYESDDETGFFFDQLKQMQLLLNGVFEGDEHAEKEKE
jgi:hypothetical protein